MVGDWLTYAEAAERLGITAEAVRYRAMRGRWPRQRGNDGRARVQLPDAPPSGVPTASAPRANPRSDPAHLDALNAHIETLKNELSRCDAQLVTERERADRAIAELLALAQRLASVEEARAALAEEQSRPLWRRVLEAATRSAQLGLISFTARSIVTHVALVSAALALLMADRG
jgi:hypothetical protein